MDRQFSAKPPTTTVVDIAEMSDTPKRGSHHRRAHSDTTFRFDDLLLFDASDLDLSAIDLTPTPNLPSPSPFANDTGGSYGFPMSVDSPSMSDDSSNLKPRASGHVNHLRSLSMDSDFFDNIGFMAEGEKGSMPEKMGYQHRHSNSMDGTSSFDGDSIGVIDGVKKAMAPDRLAELSLIDPKRAKRILANRQSAARSKERKIRYTGELERKVQTLQTEATTLSAQVTLLQRDTTGLTTENKELKLRLQAMEQQAHLRDALNEALREEVQRLKIATGQIPPNSNAFNRGLPSQFPPHQPPLHHFGSHQTQQHQHHQQQMPQSSNINQTRNGQPHANNFSDFNQRT